MMIWHVTIFKEKTRTTGGEGTSIIIAMKRGSLHVDAQ
jgi:hypothetical protein